jgi:uncharacterized membrane protein
MKSEAIEKGIGRLLTWGVRIATVALGLAWAIQILSNATPWETFANYEPAPWTFERVSQAGLADGLAYFGLIVLVSVPFLRVLYGVLAFLKQGEWILSSLSALVFLGLATGLFLGLAH